MSRHELDLYVVTSPDNVFYLTNFANFVHERPFVLVVGLSGELRFVVPRLEMPHVQARAVGTLDLIPYREFPAPSGDAWSDALRSILAPNARVGVESVCPLHVFEILPGQRVHVDVVDDARMVKSDYEIGRIVYACNLLSDAHGKLLANARPGRSMAQVAGEATAYMLPRVLSDRPDTNMLATRLTAVFQPPNVSHDPHNFTNVHMQMCEGGPHVSVLNGTVNGYGAEIERTWFLGHVPEQARKPFDVMMQARALALELTVPGRLMSEVDRRVNALFEKEGFGNALLHRTGHGIGVTGHEAPFLAEGYDRVILPGMVFTIEPGIYVPGVGGFRHSDTVLTTAGGNVSLTQGADSLEAMTLPIRA